VAPLARRTVHPLSIKLHVLGVKMIKEAKESNLPWRWSHPL
jgi:hypothetical protein